MIPLSVFVGNDFTYGNISSSMFGVKILYLNNDFNEENLLSSSVEILSCSLPRRSNVFQIGVGYSSHQAFEFEISFFREQEKPFDTYERNIISQWLTGDMSFKPLRIIQEDMTPFYYNCYFKDLKYISVDGNANGFKATVVCDAPFAWKAPTVFEKIVKPLYGNIYPDSLDFDLYNQSSDHNLTIPELIEIDLGENNSSVAVENRSNNGSVFRFNNLLPGDKIRIDGLHMMECTNRPNSIIVDLFSGDFLELVNGINKIHVTGQIKRIKIIWKSGVKIG